MSKIILSVIVYAPCLNKTIIKLNKKQMNSSADTFFWMTRYHFFWVDLLPPSGRITFDLQLNPALQQFKGLIKIIFCTDVFIIANIWITMKMLLGTKICIVYLRVFFVSGCATAGFHYIFRNLKNFLF